MLWNSRNCSKCKTYRGVTRCKYCEEDVYLPCSIYWKGEWHDCPLYETCTKCELKTLSDHIRVFNQK